MAHAYINGKPVNWYTVTYHIEVQVSVLADSAEEAEKNGQAELPHDCMIESCSAELEDGTTFGLPLDTTGYLKP